MGPKRHRKRTATASKEDRRVRARTDPPPDEPKVTVQRSQKDTVPDVVCHSLNTLLTQLIGDVVPLLPPLLELVVQYLQRPCPILQFFNSGDLVFSDNLYMSLPDMIRRFRTFCRDLFLPPAPTIGPTIMPSILECYRLRIIHETRMDPVAGVNRNTQWIVGCALSTDSRVSKPLLS